MRKQKLRETESTRKQLLGGGRDCEGVDTLEGVDTVREWKP